MKRGRKGRGIRKKMFHAHLLAPTLMQALKGAKATAERGGKERQREKAAGEGEREGEEKER